MGLSSIFDRIPILANLQNQTNKETRKKMLVKSMQLKRKKGKLVAAGRGALGSSKHE